MKTGLLLIDIQNDYFPGGAMELVDMERAAAVAGGMLERFRDEARPVYHLQHLSVRPGATFFVPDTAGAEIHPTVSPHDGETLFQKNFPNGFRGTGLLDALRADGTGALVICGAMSHMCIDATTRAAFDNGISCTVLSDGCATRDLEHEGRRIPAGDVHAAFMAALSVPYARVVRAEALGAIES
ncbi:MAG: cysteine hydrolase family protein [Gammaproteobacteria bacterium]|nr:cysteine hydrolase family protein [Gammaproteobacteria bacterium]